MIDEKDLADSISCYVCAWRETCKKRFSYPPEYAKRCPDFSWDMAIKKRIIKELEEKKKIAEKE